LKIASEKTENREIVFEVEAEPEEVERSLDWAYRRLVQRHQVPGFRKGKAPRDMLERYIGRGALLEEALKNLVPQLINQAIDERQVEPVAQPEIEITGIEPVTFKATVPLMPVVELGDYGGLSIPREPANVTDEDASSVIEQLRLQHSTWEPVERPVQFGDLTTIDVTAQVEGKSILDRKGLQYQVIEGMPVPAPGFPEGLIGAEIGQARELNIALPADFSDKEIAGKDCLFNVRIEEIKQQKLPELDDEFARSLGQGFETVEDLRQDVTTHLQAMAEDNARRTHENRVIDALADMSRVEFPTVMVEREIDRLISMQENELRAQRISLEDYLKNQKKSGQELRDELRPIASRQITRSMVLSKLAEAQSIVISDEELDAEIEIMAQNAGKNGDSLRKLFQSPGTRNTLRGTLITRKTIGCLVEMALGNKPASEDKPQTADGDPATVVSEGSGETNAKAETSATEGQADEAQPQG